MKNLNIILIFIALMGMASSCNFEDINKNPNAPVEVPASNILGAAFPAGYGPVFDTRMNCYYAGAYCGQVKANDYEYRGSEINDPNWDSFYRAMRICVEAMEVAKKEGNDNIYAAALVMKVFYGNKVVNSWGDVPYSEAFRMKDKEPVLHPKYDAQKDIYVQQLAELKEASELLDPAGKPLGPGDFLFFGDVLKWKKFANSMRLRLAIRATSGEEAVGTPTLKEVADNLSAYPPILENDDNAYWFFPGIAPYEERWYAQNVGRRDATGYKVSGWRAQIDFIEALVDNNDPRTPVYFDKNRAGEYNGWEFGVAQGSRPENRTDSTSAFGDRFCGDPEGFMPFANAAETYFNIAEAALKGYISGGDARAKEQYEKGIRISCEENGIDPAAIETFLNEPEIKWNSGTSSNMDKIALQRWIVLFKQSLEAWTEVRRTDVPVLDRIDEAYMDRHNRPPFRMVYSGREKATNHNFPENVVENDLFYGGQLWWDKRQNVF